MSFVKQTRSKTSSLFFRDAKQAKQTLAQAMFLYFKGALSEQQKLQREKENQFLKIKLIFGCERGLHKGEQEKRKDT